MKVLLLEDDKECRESIRFMIELIVSKVEIFEASTIRKGEEILLENKGNMDMIVVDGDLPDGSGVSFTKYVRVNYPNEIIKIIGRPGDIGKEIPFINAGADVFCPKPDADKLIEIFKTHQS